MAHNSAQFDMQVTILVGGLVGRCGDAHIVDFHGARPPPFPGFPWSDSADPI